VGIEKADQEGCLVLKKPCGIVEKVALELIEQAVVFLPDDVKAALQKAYRAETSALGKSQLKNMRLFAKTLEP
jgi:tartrate dehydratase alpha subunit/fumarate hydratase class I-like protein